MKSKREARILRKSRIRKKITGTPERPRLTVYKSLTNIYVQIIDDVAGKTIAAASTADKDFSVEKGSSRKNIGAAEKVGEMIARKAASKSIDKVVFDRNGYLYQGKVAKLVEKVREGGIVV